MVYICLKWASKVNNIFVGNRERNYRPWWHIPTQTSLEFKPPPPPGFDHRFSSIVHATVTGGNEAGVHHVLIS